jgi:gliding motility-associated lipoprotein GldH
MRFIGVLLLGAMFFTACDDTRVYEKNNDFENRAWTVSDTPTFEIEVLDTVQHYNLFCNIRNSVAYPYSRLFFTYYIQDSIGKPVQQKLVNHLLFDPKSGEPQGNSGLGDIFDHRVVLLRNYKFQYSGKHRIKFTQLMRQDTLAGILAVGVRVEKAINEK